MNLDREIPQGDPDATLCRWCYGAKTRVSGGWLRRGCDALGHTLAVANEQGRS